MVLAGGLSGLVIGIALTYVTVIVPRSLELDRFTGQSGLALPMERLIRGEAEPVISWTIEDEPIAAPVYRGKRPSRHVRARAVVPIEEQEAVLALIAQRIQSSISTSGYLSHVGSSSTREGVALYWHQEIGYVVSNSSGMAYLIGVAEGENLVLLIVFDEN